MDAAPAKLDLVIYQGQDFDPDAWVWSTGPDLDNQTPVDLTGATAKLQVRPAPGSPTLHFELASGSGLTLGGTAGTIKPYLNAAGTTGLTFRKAVYDLEVTFPDGKVRRVMGGKVTVNPQVTV